MQRSIENWLGVGFPRSMIDGGGITVRCPAKLNLFLEVLDKRSDGYHEIDTVMTCISLFDRLSFAVAEASEIQLRHEVQANHGSMQLPPPRENLITKALLRFQQAANVTSGATVKLSKAIPTQAGMGGASSNVAAALLLANRLWRVDWPIARLSEFAAGIGSDIPFFLSGGSAVCSGRGERVERCPGISRVPLVVVGPPVGFSTADIYREHQPPAAPRSSRALVAALRTGNVRSVGRLMFNRLQEAAGSFSDWPARLAHCFSRLPAIGHQMTGSGSCYFALFGTHQAANFAASRVRITFPECRVIKCELENSTLI